MTAFTRDNGRVHGSFRLHEMNFPGNESTLGALREQKEVSALTGQIPEQSRTGKAYYARDGAGMDASGEAGDGGIGRDALAYADTLYNLARYLTGNPSDAQDLVQDTYVHALRAAGQFTPGTNLKAWLFRILRNRFISLYRRQRHNPLVGGLDTVDPTAQGPSQERFLLDDIELDRLRKIVGEEIEEALMSLSEEARTVILLDLEGLTEVEVAEVIGCAVGTVKSRLARARAALRLKLKDYAR